MILPWETNIQYLKGVGKKRSELFQKLGVSTVGTLLRFYPRDYMDWSKAYSIADAPYDSPCCVRAVIAEPVKAGFIRKGMTIYKTRAVDESGTLFITLFNNPYTAEKLVHGKELIFFGQLTGKGNRREVLSPLIGAPDSSCCIHPIYHQTAGLSGNIITQTVKKALSFVKGTLQDPLSKQITEKFKLCSLEYAIENIHFPETQQALHSARRRLIFEELLYLQIGLLSIKSRTRTITTMCISDINPEEFFRLLPFSPTNAQRRTVCEALCDMKKNIPMSRLLQGDVGSGKTVVAAALCYCAAKSHMQSAIMAPTEILAEQHFHSFSSLLESTDIKIQIITGSTAKNKKQEIYRSLINGETNIIIGTHALLSENVTFQRLGLVITDEQHRFGVSQRASLASKGNNPHIFVMSATPIPRTLALMIYGDLDISFLDELPPGRSPVDTYVINSKKRERAFQYMKKHIDDGRQAYIVCPLIEEGESSLASAEQYFQNLKKETLFNYKIGLLHGKMKPSEKESVMRDFSQHKIDILVSTTVIEVGIDVPNAVIMIIENAERFGLSQLHQLRGRIGRGNYHSTCILISDAQNQTTLTRMKIMCNTNDGFQIASEDLKLRGPGDFFGSRQHGLPSLKIADMANDSAVLLAAQNTAREMLKKDPDLSLAENVLIKKEVDNLFSESGGYRLN